MNQLNDEIKKKIVEFLKDKEIGASSSEISKGISHNRITVSKYLEIMNALNIITCKDIAQAKIWSLKEKQPKKKILIVDDEHHIVNLIKLSIKANKYLIFEAYNGKDALNIVEKEAPELIILDLMMPEMDGFEICKRIKQNQRTSKSSVLILSAKNELDNKFKGINIGADDYLTKPFDPIELEDRVESILSENNNELFDKTTGLPNKNSLDIYLENNKNITKAMEIKINGLEKYRDNNGTHNSQKVLKLISRLIKDKAKDDLGSYVACIDQSTFLLITKLSNIDYELKLAFEYLIPFIYHNKTTDNKITLEFREISINK